MKIRFLLLAMTMSIAGCSDGAGPMKSYADESATNPQSIEVRQVAAPPAADAAAAGPAGRPESAPATGAAPLAVSTPLLAYSYRYHIETPTEALRGLIRAHEAACASAGPAACQMVGQNVHAEGKDRLAGELRLRATPAWIARFRANVDGQAKAAGGRVIGSNTDSEDLTRQIVDTEAALRAKTTLRDRLQAVLATRPGKLSELLEVEQALANVQQEIDATQSALAVMRTRVATSALTIQYSSEGVLAAEGVWSPVRRAMSDALGLIADTIAALIRLTAILLPIAIVLGLLIWLLRGRVRWPWRRRKAPPPTD